MKQRDGLWLPNCPTAFTSQEDVRGPYTVDDLIGEIITDSVSRETVLTVLREAGAPGFMTNVLLRERGNPLRPILQRMWNADEVIQKMNAALAGLPAG